MQPVVELRSFGVSGGAGRGGAGSENEKRRAGSGAARAANGVEIQLTRKVTIKGL